MYVRNELKQLGKKINKKYSRVIMNVLIGFKEFDNLSILDLLEGFWLIFEGIR